LTPCASPTIGSALSASPSRGLIRSMLIIGSTQAVNVLIAILRMKVLAILLGPAGVGLLGIYNNLQSTVSTAAGLGMRSSGVRELASTKAGETALSRVRVVLFAAHLIQGAIAMVAVWLLRDRLAEWLLGSTEQSTEVGLVGLAALLTLLASSQTALLQGLRRIGDLGRVTVYGALAGTAAGLLAVWLEGENGLIWFVLAQPLTAVMVAYVFTRRLPRPIATQMSLGDVWTVWRPMATLGAVFMLGGLATTATLLLVRGLIARDLGLEAAGLFAASWGVTIQYVGFLLTAMSADYYPRLAGVINDRDTAARLMNDQIQLCLTLGGPLLLLLIGLAPWVLMLLYSADFTSATEMLQWQTVGNFFKLASWPLGFALIASARSGLYLAVELLWNGLFLGLLHLGLPSVGLTMAGTAFFAAYVIHFAFLAFLVHSQYGFRWELLSLRLFAVFAVLILLLFGIARMSPAAGAATSIVLALATGAAGLRIVVTKIGPTGRAAGAVARVYAAFGWPIADHDTGGSQRRNDG